MRKNQPNTGIQHRQSTAILGERYRTIRQTTEKLITPLSAEDCTIQSMPDASPVKWHLAHTNWFFETFVLAPAVSGYRTYHPQFKVLFNSYYNAVGDKFPRPKRGLLSRPSLDEVLRYRGYINQNLLTLIGQPIDDALTDLIELGLQHEQQHQELILTDIKHLLSCNFLRPAYQKKWPLTSVQARKPHWIRYKPGMCQIGHSDKSFAFDNETPRHTQYVAEFELSSHLVTHGEYLAFIADGGYSRPELWLALGWDRLQSEDWSAPLYWEQRDGCWYTFTLHGMTEIDPNTPVCHVSYFEADAYARWAGARLPSEFEWEIAATKLTHTTNSHNFLESQALHPLALREKPPAGEPAQLFGDVWEWTHSAYSPYPGYRVLEGAIGEYNGKFMCNQYVLRGGSCVTPSSHIRATYRNFFPPEARWQFSGIRLARNVV